MPSPPSSATSIAPSIEDQLFAYAECMRDNGYEMADPDFDQ